MKRCSACDKLNGDYQSTCQYCHAKLEEKKLVLPIDPSEPRVVILGPIIPYLIILYGIVLLIVGFIRLRSVQFDALLFVFVGYGMLKTVRKVNEIEDLLKSVNYENRRLKKEIESFKRSVSSKEK